MVDIDSYSSVHDTKPNIIESLPDKETITNMTEIQLARLTMSMCKPDTIIRGHASLDLNRFLTDVALRLSAYVVLKNPLG